MLVGAGVASLSIGAGAGVVMRVYPIHASMKAIAPTAIIAMTCNARIVLKINSNTYPIKPRMPPPRSAPPSALSFKVIRAILLTDSYNARK